MKWDRESDCQYLCLVSGTSTSLISRPQFVSLHNKYTECILDATVSPSITSMMGLDNYYLCRALMKRIPDCQWKHIVAWLDKGYGGLGSNLHVWIVEAGVTCIWGAYILRIDNRAEGAINMAAHSGRPGNSWGDAIKAQLRPFWTK